MEDTLPHALFVYMSLQTSLPNFLPRHKLVLHLQLLLTFRLRLLSFAFSHISSFALLRVSVFARCIKLDETGFKDFFKAN